MFSRPKLTDNRNWISEYTIYSEQCAIGREGKRLSIFFLKYQKKPPKNPHSEAFKGLIADN